MSRNIRQDPIEGWHHVTNHAVAGEDLFRTDRDRHEFLRRLSQAATKYEVEVLAYCLMGNHVHLVLYCPNGGLARFMHFLESVYAREFNMRHGRRGALFASEYSNKLILHDGQAMATIRYVHRNPLELGIDIRTYPWSSYLAYRNGSFDDAGLAHLLLDNVLGGIAEHVSYVETDFPSDDLKMSMGIRTVHGALPASVDQSIAQLCELAAESCAVTTQEIVAPRSRARNDARQAVSLIAYESRTGFAEELRSLLGYQSGAGLRTAVKRARQRMTTDAQFRELVFRLRHRWAQLDRATAG